MKRRLFTALAALTVISTVASPIAVADTPDQSVPGDNVQTRPGIDDSSLHPAGVRLLVPDVLKNAQDGVFIVRLAEDSVATYKGGVAGFQATSAVVAGSRSLDASSPKALDYAGFLAARQSELVSRMERDFGRSVEVLHTYQFALKWPGHRSHGTGGP